MEVLSLWQSQSRRSARGMCMIWHKPSDATFEWLCMDTLCNILLGSYWTVATSRREFYITINCWVCLYIRGDDVLLSTSKFSWRINRWLMKKLLTPCWKKKQQMENHIRWVSTIRAFIFFHLTIINSEINNKENTVTVSYFSRYRSSTKDAPFPIPDSRVRKIWSAQNIRKFFHTLECM